MATGSPSPGPRPMPARRPGRGRFRFALFMLVLIFGAGFYTGVAATRRITTAPAWVQTGFTKVFGPAPAPPPVMAQANGPAPIAPSNPVGPPGATNASTQPNNAPDTSGAVTPKPLNGSGANTTAASANGGAGSGTASNPANGSTNNAPSGTSSGGNGGNPSHSASTSPSKPNAPDDLDRMVADYNNVLRRIQESQRNYDAAHRAASDSRTPPQDLQVALDRQNSYIDEIVSGTQRAQSLADTIHADPQFAQRYQDKEACLTIERVPPTLLDSGVDKLCFIRRH